MNVKKEENKTAINDLHKNIEKGLFQYFLNINSEAFEGYANHTDEDIKFYNDKMELVHTLDKSEIRSAFFNPNDVLVITTAGGIIYMER